MIQITVKCNFHCFFIKEYINNFALAIEKSTNFEMMLNISGFTIFVSYVMHIYIYTFFGDKNTLLSFTLSGLVEDIHDFWSKLNFLMRVQTHDCDKAGQRCMKRVDKEGNLQCRVPRQEFALEAHFKAAKNLFDEDTLKIMKDLGLTGTDAKGNLTPPESLQGGRWYYRAFAEETNVSPMIPLISWTMLSTTNIQKCDRRFLLSYLLKYSAGSDEKVKVHIKADPEMKQANVEVGEHEHTKITGQQLLRKDDSKDQRQLVRQIAVTEMVFLNTSLSYINTNISFVHFSTNAPENRCAVLRTAKSKRQDADTAPGEFAVIQKRSGLSNHLRHFTSNQKVLIEDFETGLHCLDQTSAFSLRPPELLCISHLKEYTKFCSSTPIRPVPSPSDSSIAAVSLVDGARRMIRFRVRHVIEAKAYLERKLQTGNFCHPDDEERARNLLNEILLPVCAILETSAEGGLELLRRDPLGKKFVDFNNLNEVLAVYTSASPKYLHPFMIHLLLLFGDFHTELDLYSHATLRDAFVAAKILPSSNYSEADVLGLIRRYLMEDLHWQPITTRSLQRLLKLASVGIKEFFLSNRWSDNSPPLCLMRQIQLHYSDEVQRMLSRQREVLVDVLSNSGISNFPNVDDLKNRVPNLTWSPLVRYSSRQTDASFQEQQKALRIAMEKIDASVDTAVSFIKGTVFTGAPGCGKTFVLNLIATYALCKQLEVVFTCLTAQRARELGGIHMHQLFHLQVSNAHSLTAHQHAENSLLALSKDVFTTALLRKLDVICIDEIGMISLEMFATVNIILQKVRKSNAPFGGVLIFASGDYAQLPPVTGDLIWCSTAFLTIIDVVVLKQMVRAMDDVDLQRVIEILRLVQISDDEKDEAMAILQRRFTDRSFVRRFEDVPDHYAKIVAKRAGVNKFIVHEKTTMSTKIDEENRQRRLRGEACIDYVTFSSKDRIEDPVGRTPLDATVEVSATMNRLLREQQSLFVYEKQILRFTRNDPDGRYTQGQLCRVEIISRDRSDNPDGVYVTIAPPGQADIPAVNRNQLTKIGQVASNPLVIRKQVHQIATRIQLPLVPAGVATIHRCIGQTLHAVATKFSTTEKNYMMWMREQLLVTLSRVSNLDNVLFVASPNNFKKDKEDTFKAIRDVMGIMPRRWRYIAALLQTTNIIDRPFTMSVYLYANAALAANPSSLPNDRIGYVYCLVSTKFPERGYIGQTNVLQRRLREHNSASNQDTQTGQDQLKPWIVAAFVCGFPELADSQINLNARLNFESQVRDRMNFFYVRKRREMNSLELRTTLEEVMQEINADPSASRFPPNTKLRFVEMASMNFRLND